MKIVILGAGQVGRTVAYQLSREEANEVTVVDVNEDILRDLQDRIDIRTVAGNGAYPSVLEAAGAAEADIIIALTNSDEVNIMACEVADTLFRTPTKIARIRSAEYTARPELFSDDALAGGFLHQPGAAGHRVHRTPDRTSRAPCRCWISRTARCAWSACAPTRTASSWGSVCANCASTCPKTEARVVAIYRQSGAVKPEGETVIEDGDEVFFLAGRD